MLTSLNCGQGSLQKVWINEESGREALVKFTYKDSARRVLASYGRDDAFIDVRCEMASADIIDAFLAKEDTNQTMNVLKEQRRILGIADGLKFRKGGYVGSNMPTLSELEAKVRQKLATLIKD